MNTFFLLLEVFLYAFAIYIFFWKSDLAIVYLPVLIFTYAVITTHVVSAFVYYGIISLLLLNAIRKNTSFLGSNFFSFLIAVYFLMLMGKSKDIETIRQDLFYVLWLFLSIPLMTSIYKKYPRPVIFKELSTSAFIILIVFIVNVALSSLFQYDVHSMYGITSGILYGNLYATDFNILGIAVFIILLNLLHKKNPLYLIVLIISLFFIGLSMRRSVWGVSALGVVVVMLILFSQNVKKVVVFGAIAFLIGAYVLTNTNFESTFNERYELRRLDDRSLDEEKRFIEYELLYDDMFRYGRYSPWFGFGLFDSPGNYGGGIFYDRSLHGDLTSIAHSSGLLGVGLYLLMIFTAFYKALQAAETKTDKLIVLFCALAFLIYTSTGRYTQAGCMMLLFLLLNLTLAEKENEYADMQELEGVPSASENQSLQPPINGMQVL